MNLLVSDLDGTLLNKDSKVPKNIELFINKLKDKDFVFSIATARSPQNVSHLFKYLKINYTAFCSDGAITVSNRNNLFSIISEDFLSETSINYLHPIFNKIKDQTKLYFSTSSNDFKIYIENSGNISNSVFSDIFPFRKWEIVPSFSLLDAKTNKFRAFSLFTNELINLNFQKNFGFKYINYTETRFFEGNYFWHDFLPIETSKGNALKKHKEKYIKIIALGNGENDIELFNVSDNSFCPKDSDAKLKAISKNIIFEECGEYFIKQVIKKI